MRVLFYFMAFTLMAAALAACQATQENTKASVNRAVPSATTHGDGVRRITPTELRELMEKGQVTVIDVRNEASYYAGHVPTAKLIPNTAILNHLQELPRDRLIVTYCS
jgi:3-mercaptopyruvate sulfurtransferase SseA